MSLMQQLLIATSLTAAVLSGCSSVHLSDSSRDATAKLAVEQRDAAALGKVSTQSAELLDELRSKELDATSAAHDFLWQNDLFRIFASDTGTRDEHLTHWITKIDQRLAAIGYRNRRDVTSFLELEIARKAEREKIAKTQRDIALVAPELADSIPPCGPCMPASWPEDNVRLDAQLRKDASELFELYRLDCQSYLEKPSAVYDGVLKSAYESAAKRRAELEGRKRKAEEVTRSIDSLRKEIDKITQSNAPPSKMLREVVERLSQRITEAKKWQSETEKETDLAKLEKIQLALRDVVDSSQRALKQAQGALGRTQALQASDTQL